MNVMDNHSLSSFLPKPEALRILVIGSGGREHAIALHLLKSNRVEHVFVAPGNGGTSTIDAARCSNLIDVKASGDFSEICNWAKSNKVSFEMAREQSQTRIFFF